MAVILSRPRAEEVLSLQIRCVIFYLTTYLKRYACMTHFRVICENYLANISNSLGFHLQKVLSDRQS